MSTYPVDIKSTRLTAAQAASSSAIFAGPVRILGFSVQIAQEAAGTLDYTKIVEVTLGI